MHWSYLQFLTLLILSSPHIFRFHSLGLYIKPSVLKVWMYFTWELIGGSVQSQYFSVAPKLLRLLL